MSELLSISSNSFSHDQQIADTMEYLKHNHFETYVEIRHAFSAEWTGVDWMVFGCPQDPEYGSWLCDAIEETGLVLWWEGEPFVNNEALQKVMD